MIDTTAGSGICGWQTEKEEDVWETDIDFGGNDREECDSIDEEMTINEQIKRRYLNAEKARELLSKNHRMYNY